MFFIWIYLEIIKFIYTIIQIFVNLNMFRYLLFRIVTTNFPPLFYIAAARREFLKNALVGLCLCLRYTAQCAFWVVCLPSNRTS